LALNGSEITPDVFKHELDLKLDRKTEQKIQVRIADYIREIILGTDAGRSPQTLKHFNNLANKIEAYEQKRNIVISADRRNLPRLPRGVKDSPDHEFHSYKPQFKHLYSKLSLLNYDTVSGL
jgi:hypothetical protein